MSEISDSEAVILERFDVLEMARLIDRTANDLAWIGQFAKVRSEDNSKVFARVNHGALRNISARALEALARIEKP